MKIAGRQYYIFRLEKKTFFETDRISGIDKWQCDKFHFFNSEGKTIFVVWEGYKWDGCTPKWSFLDLVFGMNDGVPNPKTGKPKAYFASCIHDILYEHAHILPKEITRKIADQIFYDELKKADFKLAKIYYWGVRLLGGFWWRKSKRKL